LNHPRNTVLPNDVLFRLAVSKGQSKVSDMNGMKISEGSSMKVYDDDGTEMNAYELPARPLCTTCRHNNDPKQEPMCLLTRLDQKGDVEFRCDAYEAMLPD